MGLCLPCMRSEYGNTGTEISNWSDSFLFQVGLDFKLVITVFIVSSVGNSNYLTGGGSERYILWYSDKK